MAILYHIERGAGFDAEGTWHEPDDPPSRWNLIGVLPFVFLISAGLWFGFAVLGRWVWGLL